MPLYYSIQAVQASMKKVQPLLFQFLPWTPNLILTLKVYQYHHTSTVAPKPRRAADGLKQQGFT
jgi:hypothetical protein